MLPDALREPVHAAIPWVIYLGVLLTVVVSAVKRSQWGLLLLIVLIPQPNVWYKVQTLPLGTNTLDMLICSTILGAMINNGGFEKPPRTFLLCSFMLLMYAALWNSSLRFGMPLPLTTANPLIPDFKNYIEMILLYFVTYNAIKTEEGQKTAVTLMVAVALFIGLRSLMNFQATTSFSYNNRADGPFWIVGLGANHFGSWIAYVGAFFIGLMLVERNPLRKLLSIAALGSLMLPFFGTYSRGAYVALVAALGAFGALRKRAILVGLLVLGITWTTVLPKAVVERISMTETADGQIEESAALRFVMWERAKELFADHPVFGIGFEGFSVSVRIAGLTNVHNFYMQTACEEGVIGLLLFALVFLGAGASGWRLYRIGKSDFQRAMGLGFIGAIAAMGVSNVFGDRWSQFTLGAYFWIFWGLVDRSLTLSQVAGAARQAAPLPARIVSAEPVPSAAATALTGPERARA